MRNTECSPSVLHVTHDFLWFYCISLQLPLFQAEASVAWVAFASLFLPLFILTAFPALVVVLYIFEKCMMCVLRVAQMCPLFHFLFFFNTSSCTEDKPTAQWPGPVAASILWILQQWPRSGCCRHLRHGLFITEGRMILAIWCFPGPVACALHRVRNSLPRQKWNKACLSFGISLN